MRRVIKAMRNLLGLTLNEVAEVVGVNKSAIGNYESGITTLSTQTIAKICDILGVDIEKKRIKKGVYYFSVKSDKDWVDFEYLDELAREFLNVSEIVCFEVWHQKFTFVEFFVMYEPDIENVYVVMLKKPAKRDVVANALSSMFPSRLVKFEHASKELLQKIKAKKATKEDLEQYLYFTYCYKSRRVPVKTLSGSISYVHEVPIDIILSDFWKYIKYEPNLERKKRYLKELISDVLLKTERPPTEEDYKIELERRLRRAYELFNIKENRE